ncbi:MAG TPA: hypothetical protein VGP80_11580 [Gemmatimonadales bacterium]|jgi:hypothetical protein|nr:hypothetical protein [Gemmatimonadales bacterium]
MNPRILLSALAAGAFSLACHDSQSNDPPEFGSIQVSNTTTGPLIPGPFYFHVVLDGAIPRILRTDSILTIDSVPAGTHSTDISLLRSQCSVPDSSIATNVVADDTTAVQFNVSCAVNWGFLAVGLPTSGPNQPSPLIITFDGVAIGGADPNTAGLGFPYVPAGAHSIGLTGAGANCLVAESNPQDVVIPLDDTLHINFTLTCS